MEARAMDEPNLNQPAGDSRRFLPLLLPLFAASGCAALIYETADEPMTSCSNWNQTIS